MMGNGELYFTKMHGLGNDFVVLDGVNQSVNLSATQIRQIADRHRGVGCDQLLLVEAYEGMMLSSGTEFLMPMAARWNSVAMVHAVLRVSCMIRV